MTLLLRRWLWIAWNPMRILWLFVLVSAALVPFLTRNHPAKAQRGEWYPFSNFPMYSDFEETAYYVYVTDREDKPVALAETFGVAPSDVKKAYDQKLKKEVERLKNEAKARGTKYTKRIVEMSAEECRPVGEAALKELRDNTKYQEAVRKLSGLRLYQVDITLDNGRIVKKTKLVGEI
jgi:hypothetical protein